MEPKKTLASMTSAFISVSKSFLKVMFALHTNERGIKKMDWDKYVLVLFNVLFF